ncbi:hypothetical protein [Frigoriglobus tundricola]|uniref:Uncharacterized protein n=1 Tax=Frigoriglobus tundricola TaxID=2774151 RepID=A0A6M5YQF8_9BACT|nr:hypothetical protein [Frigoriglobus tundricola]QJW95202.1 hypothetical protein FTUN_2744 [Frigoriglobus tundricola]
MRGFRELDRILRGTAVPVPGGAPAGPGVPIGPLLVVDVILAAFYGVCMGAFGVFGRGEADARFLLADALKVPLLFLLTIAVTAPSLYVFGALVGSRLTVPDLARSFAAALGVLVAVLAAFGPIVAFFSVTTTSYPFIMLLNVAVFALAAVFAVGVLLRTANPPTPPEAPPEGGPDAAPGATTGPGAPARCRLRRGRIPRCGRCTGAGSRCSRWSARR